MTGFRTLGALPEVEGWRGALVMAQDEAGRVLMQLRDDRHDIAAPGQWGMFGGGVEPQETLVEAAVREFREETGIWLSEDELAPLVRVPSHARPDGVLYVFHTDRSIAPRDVRLGEGAGFAFLTPAQLLRFEVIAPLRPLFAEMFD
ncbi:7,8-dihydro-8-oxoguanine-triphosphatase [Rhodosalinus halophilus]|uniref:7,8-dihydro-8-oxoguanine-triphosphatase n=1 Tax=Rhodosalinus halophilus TaxID=2259333 RepID=A0A365UBN7_9RHOB|nr:NUDIX domain-containing protein [Rhodosalinus halophilus]RBI85717.1 7,8-dihydro-8-oxoguanine-triphosphatase [Rhodosalinus halophilus]